MKISNFVPSSNTVESLKLDIPNPFFSESVEGGTTSPVDITGGGANAFTLFGLAGCSSEKPCGIRFPLEFILLTPFFQELYYAL